MRDNKSLDEKIRALRKRVDACDRLAAHLLVRIAPLPLDHPERRAAVAKLRALRPRALQAMDELQYLQIKYALRLRDTPIDLMARA